MDVSRRTVQMVAAIFRFSIASGWVQSNPAADLRGALAARPRVRHHAMIAPKDTGSFLRLLRGYDGDEMTRLAIETVIRTAVRTSELRLGQWTEIEGNTWRIPGDRMKVAGIDHIVPFRRRCVDYSTGRKRSPATRLGCLPATASIT